MLREYFNIYNLVNTMGNYASSKVKIKIFKFHNNFINTNQIIILTLL